MTLGDEYSRFLNQLSEGLLTEGFEIARTIKLDNYQLDFVGKKTVVEARNKRFTRFILVSAFEEADINTILDYSSRSTQYALDNLDSNLPRGFGQGLLAVPVIVSHDFSDTIKKWIAVTLMKKHWAAFEFPVLISLSGERLYYCTKTPIWGAIYYHGFRKFIEEHLSFEPR